MLMSWLMLLARMVLGTVIVKIVLFFWRLCIKVLATAQR